MERLKQKLEDLTKALKGLDEVMNVDTKTLPTEVLKDAIENARVQKFEYSTELTWKTIKAFLLDKEGVDSKSPKGAIREFFLKKYISEKEFDDLIQMIDDRNALSHVYSEEAFDLISDKLDSYNR